MDLAIITRTWQFVLPVAPESVDVSYEGVYAPFTSITEGVFKIPAGRQPQGLSFDVLLPGHTTLAQLYPDTAWTDEASFPQAAAAGFDGQIATEPLVYVADLQQAIETNKSMVYLLCHELRLAGVYFAEKVQAKHGGAFGDVTLSCQFTEYRPVVISTTAAPGSTAPAPAPGGPSDVPSPTDAASDGTPSGGGTYTTGDQDTLATVAARVRGLSDPDAYAQAVWEYDGNSDAITAAGGQQDGTLPAGVSLSMPPAS